MIFWFGVWGDQVFFLLQLFALFSLSLSLTRAGGVPLWPCCFCLGFGGIKLSVPFSFLLFSLSLSNEGRGGAPLAVIFWFGVWGDQVFFLLQLFALFSLSLSL